MTKARRVEGFGETYFRFTFSELRQQLPGTDPHLLLGLVGELNAPNFIHQPALPTVRDGSDLYSNYPLELTPLGVRFVDRMLAASAAQHRAGAVGADNDASAAAQRER